MNKVIIGGAERELNDATAGWVTEQVNNRRKDGQSICAKVLLKFSGVDIALSTPQCGGGGGGRQPNEKELRIVDLWQKHHLNEANWSPGDLVAFLKQLTHLL